MMQCPQCHNENREARRFCAKCGAPIASPCGECGFANDPDEDYCGGCGRPLRVRGTSPRDAEFPDKAADAERRQVTVMFCDLVGSTRLAERLDPEELRELLARYQQTCASVIERFDGHIARYVGDALLVYFGYPHAHEEDAQRAVQAGLDLLRTLDELSMEINDSSVELAVRIGIATGLVVVGDIGSGEHHEEMGVVGETPNIASRLQQIAEPNQLVIGASTYRLVEGLFHCQELGQQRLKGVSQLVPAYCVQAQSSAHSRFEAGAARGLSPIVGRQEEVSLLSKRWTQAKEGESQVVLLSGEGGIGKSRIVSAFQERLKVKIRNRVLYHCSPFYRNTAFYPVIDHLQRILQPAGETSPAQQFERLAGRLKDLGLAAEDHAPLLATLLALPVMGPSPRLELSAEQHKRKTLDALVAMIEAMASQSPVLMVVEDAHWSDPSTLELLSLLIEQLRSARFLLLVVFRQEFVPPWSGRAHVTALTLNRLTRKDSAALISSVAGGKELPDEVCEQIVARTDGVPLFIEELTKTVLESELLQHDDDHYVLNGPLPPLAIPASLQDSLMARLDRLSPTKEVAQMAATLGRSFSHELLAAVSLAKGRALGEALEQLVKAELIYRRGVPPDARYEFKHALVQEAAYESLLKSTRQRYHEKIARVLEKQFPQTATREPEVLAFHYTEAHLVERAIAYWCRAGERAREHSANSEAIAHFEKALSLLMRLPDSAQRAQRELELQTTLGPAWMAAKDWSAPEVERSYARARVLSERVDDTPRLFQSLWGLARYYTVSGNLQPSRELAEELLALAQRLKDTGLLVEAHLTMGVSLQWAGEFLAARSHYEDAIALYSPDQHRHLTTQYSEDPGVAARARIAYPAWMLGYPDQALEASTQAVERARQACHAFSLARALAYGAWLHALRREAEAAQDYAEEAITLTTERGFPQWLSWATVFHGWALTQLGSAEEGIKELRSGIADRLRTSASLATPHFLTRLAEAYGRAGRFQEAFATLAEVSSVQFSVGRYYGQAELEWLRGDLLLARGGEEAEAENCLNQAIQSARCQAAKSIELRAATSLARLWRARGELERARDILDPIYNSFTEGFDTPDLRDAGALLGELRSREL